MSSLANRAVAQRVYVYCLVAIIAGFVMWLTGWDLSLQKYLADHDRQWLNNIWRIIGELGLGRWQWLFCLLGVTYLVHRTQWQAYPKTFIRVFVGTFYIWLKGLRLDFSPVQRSRFFWQQHAKYVQQLPMKTRALAYAIPFMFWAGTLCLLAKIVIGRPRPKMYLWHDVSESTGPSLSSTYHSLPSGHTTTTFALLAVLLVVFPRYRGLWVILALLTAASRVITITPHFLGDVLVGAGLGFAVGTYFLRRYHLVKR